jgi:hypothetical protein
VVEMRVVEEGFRGDAADVEAGSAEGSALLDTCDLGESEARQFQGRGGISDGSSPYLHPLLASLDGGNIAGDTAADNDQVLLLCVGSVLRSGHSGGSCPYQQRTRTCGSTASRGGLWAGLKIVSTSGILSGLERISIPGRTECRPRQGPAYYSLQKHVEMCRSVYRERR